MIDFARKYYDNLSGLLNEVRTSDRNGREMIFYCGIETACNLIVSRAESGNKIIFIGNGASAAIASHISTDFWKNGGIRGIAFNDSSLLTCVSNDYGYSHVFEKPIEMFADRGDVLVAISSSGKSENIIRGTYSARTKEMFIITLSGFESDNPLSWSGDVNFFVPAKSYGLIEIIHHSICHCILDTIIQFKSK